MERNVDRKTLSFSKGITNVPSDLLSDDTELVESNGFIFRNSEMKPIQKPKIIGNVRYKITYVHKMADYENLIAIIEHTQSIACYRMIDGKIDGDSVCFFSIGETYSITSIGNTLVCSTEYGLHYLLFKGGKYKDLGSELPKPVFTPILSDTKKGEGYTCELKEIVEGQDSYAWYDRETGEFVGYYNNDDDAPENSVKGEYCYNRHVKSGRYDDFLNAVEGCVSKAINEEKEKGHFLFPFFVRYALKLYDGTYARISAPIACYPTITRNCRFYASNLKDSDYFHYAPYVSTLKYMCVIDNVDDWTDIVKELVVFASDDVNTFSDMSGTKQNDWYIYTGNNGTNVTYVDYLGGKETYEGVVGYDTILAKFKTDEEILEELKTKTQFYKIATLKVSSVKNLTVATDLPIKKNTISTLTTQEQLKVDDYFGWTRCKYQELFAYNGRINAFNAQRSPWKGFCNFLATDKEYDELTYYVHIEAEGMSAWVKSDSTKNMPDYALSGWFYYPDPRATEVIIYNETTSKGMRLSLESHNLLNGSYTFQNLPTGMSAEWMDIDLPAVDTQAYETLDSQIFTSVVNNPFVFEASGDNTVGTGKVLGIVANTEAISQGQFGQYPLFVFTDEGTYAMGVNSEGLYSTIYPVSREVCNNAESITQTDKLVYFTSEKGLMAISGGTVACMSEQMRGRIPRNFVTLGDGDFMSFLKDCKIAYDYRDSMLRIFADGKTHQYIYNMLDKTFGMTNEGMSIYSVVNDYPDNLIQDTDGNVYSLSQKPSINEDTDSAFDGTITTRPLKLGGSLNLKSLRSIKNLVDTNDGKISVDVWGSNDCKHWQKLRSLAGKPWKYFTLKYTLKGFRAADSFAGSVLEIQERREYKMR